MVTRRSALGSLAALATLLAVASPGRAIAANTWGYQPEHRETRELIDLVEGAAERVEAVGAAAACEEFRQSDSGWLHGDSYVFVLALDGEIVCHPVRPSLERPALELRDPNGKPVVQSMLRELAGGQEDGWVHYLWPRPDQQHTFYWKTSYVRRATAPDGAVHAVGSGLYQMKLERFFAVEQVEDAAALIAARGEAAFDELRDESSGFLFYDAYIFVLDEAGKTLVNVAFPELEGTDVAGLRDRDGKSFVQEMLAAVAERESAWIDYWWPKPGDAAPSRKTSYVRRVELGGKRLLVGAGVYLDRDEG